MTTKISTSMIAQVGAAYGKLLVYTPTGWVPQSGFYTIGYRTTSITGIGATETVVASAIIPANTITSGTIIRAPVVGTRTTAQTAAQTLNVRLRIGPTTLTGAIVCGASGTADAMAATNAAMAGSLSTVCLGTGTAAPCWGMPEAQTFQTLSTSAYTGSAGVNIDTTVQNLVEITVQGNAQNIIRIDCALIEISYP